MGGAQADLGKDIGKANITRGKEDIDVAITHRNDLIQAEIDHIARVQTAKVTQAEKVGQANKDLHIAGYTQAATQTANGLIADAQTEFNTKAKDSRVLRAGDIGDAAITAAESYAGNAAIQAGSWNTATQQYTTTSTTAATTWTTGTNTLSESYAQSVTTHGADWDVKVVKAYRDALADSGTSDVSWITTLTNADATRTGAQATAQASWVTNQVQAGASSLLWSGGDSTSTNASGTWVTQYAPVRTAKIVATSLIDAARQVASWFDSKEEANKQANADVKFVEDVKDPTTQVATSLTEHEGTARASANNSGTDLSKDMDSSQRRIRNAVVSIESTRAIDEAKAQKKRDVALAGLAEGASTTAVEKTYQDDMAKALFAWQQGYANLTYDEGSEQLKAVTETITEFGQAGKKYVEDAAGAEKTYTDALAPIIGTRTVSYIQAGIALLKASTGADNIWRNNTAQAWATHTGGDLTARGNAQRGVANASSLLADASRASIAEHKAQWWQTEIPNYLQWSTDVGAIETTYTDDTTDNILQRAIGVKNAGVKYATDVGFAIKDYDVNTAAAREEYISKLMTIAKSIGDTLLDAERDKEIALADAELQKQLTGNESAYSSAVQAANDAYNNTTTSAEASRKSQEQTARSTMNTKLSNELKDKEADIAAAERLYDQTVASLDAQYGSASTNGDTGVEGATRRSAIKTRDAQYYAARDTSWANTLSGSTTLGTSPWTVKAITAANAGAAYSTSRANAQAAHDAAMLDAIEDWQLSSRESLTDLLFTEGQSRESYNVANSNVYANWENGVGNLLGDKPEGTGYVPVRGFGEGGVGTWGGAGGGIFTRFEEGEDETTTSGEEMENVEPPRPTLPAPESNDSQPLIITVTGSPNDPPGAGEWLLERGRVVESCLSGKTLYCVGEWRANDSKSRNFLAEKARIDQLRREFEDIASRHNFLRMILKGDAIEELGGEKVYLENRPGFSPYVITKVIEGRLIKQLWVRSPRPGSMGKVVYTNWLMVPGEISNSDLAHIYENHLDTVEREAATQVLIDVLMQVGGELIALRMAKVIGPGGAAAKSTQILDNVNNFPLEKVLNDAPVGVVLGAGDDYLKWSDELAELFAKELKHAKGGASNTFLGTADEAAEVLAKLIKPIDGFHDIVVHADDITGKFFIKSPNGSIPIEPSTLAKHINSLGLGDDVGIRLISCNGGSCGVTGNGPAYVLQKLINRPIFAHHAPVGIRVDGSLFPYDSVVRDGIHKLIDAGPWTLIR